MKTGMIQVTNTLKKIVPWSLAASCMILCVTGLGMLFHSFSVVSCIKGGLRSLKYAHSFAGIVFAFALLFTVGMMWKETGMISISKDLGFILGGRSLPHGDMAQRLEGVRPGRKMFPLVVAGFGLIMVLTGLIMWFPLHFPSWVVGWTFVLHTLGFVAMSNLFLVHLYLWTIGLFPFLPVILTGRVTRPWFLKRPPTWLEEREYERIFVVFGEKKKTSPVPERGGKTG